MCGYCTEGLMMLKLVEARLTGVQMKKEEVLLFQYLQDYDDFNWIIKDRKMLMPHFSTLSEELVDILFCRLYDRFVARGHNEMLFKSLLATVGEAAVKNFFSKRYHSRHDQGCLGNALDILAMPGIYENQQTWDKFIEKDMTLTGNLEDCLRLYIDWCLLGKNRLKGQDQIVEETGIYDPIMDTPKEEWDKFASMFPGLFFALAYLSRTQPHSDFIKSIALTCPDGTPDFIANDLWLQRRAFLACVKTYGIEFIVTHIHKIRPQLICYAILNIDFRRNEYKRLHLAVLLEMDSSGEEDEYEGVVQLGKQILRST